MSNLDHQIEQQLYASASDLDLGPGDVGRVMARSRTRKRRQSVAALVAVVLVAGTIAGTAVARDNSRGFPVTANGNSGALGSPGATLHSGNVGVVWEKVDPHSALGFANSVTAGGSLYALSTAPGVTNPDDYPGRQIYQSSDGVNWSTARGPSDAYISDLSATGTQLYAVGTGTATVADGPFSPLVVSASADGGSSWHSVQLPIDLAAIHAGFLSGDGGGENVNVASNASGVLVVAEVGGSLDVTKFLPAGVTAPNGWVLTATGVDLLGPIDSPACPAGTTTSPNLGRVAPETTLAPLSPTTATVGPVSPTECFPANAGANAVVHASDPAGVKTVLASGSAIAPQDNHPVTASYTWAQLGLSGDLLKAAQGEPFVFFSPNGKNFQAVTLPNAPAQSQQVEMAADADNFVIAANSTPSMSGTGQGQELLWQSTDGTTWTPTAAAPGDETGLDAVGYVAGRLTTVSDTQNGPTVATLDGSQWSEASLDQVVGTVPAGDVVRGDNAAIGPFGIAVVADIAPNPTSQQTQAQIAASGAAAKAYGAVGPSVDTQRLLVSRDGTTWSSQSLNQLVGSDFSGVVPDLVVASNRFIVTAQLNGPTNLASPEIILVGSAG